MLAVTPFAAHRGGRNLYRDNLLPQGTLLVGYARSDMTPQQLAAQIKPFIKVSPLEELIYTKFIESLRYVAGTYDKAVSSNDIRA